MIGSDKVDLHIIIIARGEGVGRKKVVCMLELLLTSFLDGEHCGIVYT